MPKQLPTEQRVIRAALLVKGDSLSLAEALKVPSASVLAWLGGEKRLPGPVFDRALKIVLDSLDPEGDAPRARKGNGSAARQYGASLERPKKLPAS